MSAQSRLYHPGPLGPSVMLVCVMSLVLGACVHGPSLGPSPGPGAPLPGAQSPQSGPRFATRDAAAAAAAEEIERRNGHYKQTVFPIEWSFNIFRDAGGYYPGDFHTDDQPLSVSIRIHPTAVASGHSHIPRSARYQVCSRRGGNCSDPRELSKWDLGERGVLRAQERAGRLLPHYLAAPWGRLGVWEWHGPPERWVARVVARTGHMSWR